MTLFVLFTGLMAGLLGALIGLGGGIIVVPTLESFSSLFGRTLTLSECIALSQVGILAVSLSSTGSYLDWIRFRLSYALIPYTIAGGIIGSFLGSTISPRMIAIVFALLLFYSAFNLLRSVNLISVPLWVAMSFAGIMSGLLGIGGGTIQVPILHSLASLPMRHAIATSTFMMGITAIGNTAIYYYKDQIDIQLAGSLVIGVLIGAKCGAFIQKKTSNQQLKIIFCALMILTGIQLIWKHWYV